QGRSRRSSRRQVCQTHPARGSTRVFLARATGLKIVYFRARYPMIWSPPWRTGSFASVRTTPTSPTWSIFIRRAEPRAQDKLNAGPRRRSFREFVEANLRVDLSRDVRRHRPGDLPRLAGVAEDPHQFDIRGHRRHVLTFDDPRHQDDPASIV